MQWIKFSLQMNFGFILLVDFSGVGFFLTSIYMLIELCYARGFRGIIVLYNYQVKWFKKKIIWYSNVDYLFEIEWCPFIS